jgi:hypothetical protein
MPRRIIKNLKHEDKIDAKKKKIIWVGVSFFMVVIFIFWIINLNKVFKEIKVENDKKSDNLNLDEVKNNLGAIIDQAKAGLKDLKSPVPDGNATSSAPVVSSTTPTIEELKSVLERER